MGWVAVDKNGDEYIYESQPEKNHLCDGWEINWGHYLKLPFGSIKKLIGRELTWDDEPVKLED